MMSYINGTCIRYGAGGGGAMVTGGPAVSPDSNNPGKAWMAAAAWPWPLPTLLSDLISKTPTSLLLQAILYAPHIPVWLQAPKLDPPPLPQAANLACLSSLPFWVGGCHGNCKALQAFLVTDQAWKTILESTALYLWEILMKELPDPASVLHHENGRDVRYCCTGRGSSCQKDRRLGRNWRGGRTMPLPLAIASSSGRRAPCCSWLSGSNRGWGEHVRPWGHRRFSQGLIKVKLRLIFIHKKRKGKQKKNEMHFSQVNVGK